MITAINHITLSVSDIDASFAFYREVVGLEPIAKWARGAYLLAGTTWICLSVDRRTRAAPLPEYTHTAFSVDAGTFSVCKEHLLAQGVAIWKSNKSEGDSLYFLDPDGHKLEIHAGNLETRLASLKADPYGGLQLFTQTPAEHPRPTYRQTSGG